VTDRIVAWIALGIAGLALIIEIGGRLRRRKGRDE
jgi:hypothetical protein